MSEMSAPFNAAAAGPSIWTVLCVDDEANILAALKRTLRGAGYGVLTALGGEQALVMLEQMPIDLVISDMRMPGMDGAQLLEQVHRCWPQVMRILLTGHANIDSAVAAINRGRILRYIGKPWDEHELLGAVREAFERIGLERDRARLVALTTAQNDQLTRLNGELEARVQARTAELKEANEQLERNYLKSIKVFSNLLELRGGQLAGHGRRVAETARDVARAMGRPEDEVLRIFVAGLLHDIGLIGLLDKLLTRPVQRYAPDELALYRGHPQAGEHSLLALDDMQPLLPIIRAHHERFDGAGFPDHLAGSAIPLGARILAVADTFDDLQTGHLVEAKATAQEARTLMRHARGSQFDPEVLDVFLHITEPVKPKAAVPALRVPSQALEADMVLAADLVSARGVLMLTAGHRLTPSLIRRMLEFEQREGSALQILIRPKGLE